MKRAGKRIRRALSALLLALVLTVGISAAVCRVSLKTTEYTAAVRGLTVPLRTVVRIGGSCGHFRDINRSAKLDYAMEETIGAADVPGIVLLHMPESLLLDDARERWTGQVFLSGHTHGGVIRIPLIGGLVAPTQGLFPKYDQGKFTVDGRMTLIITSGLAGYACVPRVCNRPEVCVVDLIPEEGS